MDGLTLDEGSREGKLDIDSNTLGNLRELPLKGVYFLSKIRGMACCHREGVAREMV